MDGASAVLAITPPTLGVPPVYLLQHIARLRRGQRHRAAHRGRPDEAALVQPLGIERQAQAVVPQDLDQRSAAFPEHVEVAHVRVALKPSAPAAPGQASPCACRSSPGRYTPASSGGMAIIATPAASPPPTPPTPRRRSSLARHPSALPRPPDASTTPDSDQDRSPSAPARTAPALRPPPGLDATGRSGSCKQRSAAPSLRPSQPAQTRRQDRPLLLVVPTPIRARDHRHLAMLCCYPRP